MDVVSALDADTGITCAVGAGGKKTTLFTLAERLQRAVVTATVRIPVFDNRVATVHRTDDPVAAVRGAAEWPIGVVPEREGDRYLGYDPTTVDALAARSDVEAVLVKADGARTRWLKAPNEREPRIPETTDTVVPIASARVVGEPLTDTHVHRPDRVGSITGLAAGDRIEAEDVAAVLASDRGGLASVPSGATVVPLINMADDAALEAVARDVAAAIHELVDVPRVVLASMADEDPVVAVVD